MATTTALLSIDPTKGAKYPIALSERLLKSASGPKARTTSVELNHKPKLSESKTTSTITSSLADSFSLTIKDEDDGSKYTYSGRQRPTEACVLIYDPTTQSITLDRLDSEFTFNLQSTPTNDDAQSLAKQYPHVKSEQSENEPDAAGEVPGSEGQDTEAAADPNNPYDYRHFLHQAKRRRTSSPEPRPNIAASPAQRPTLGSSPVSRPSSRPPRPVAKPPRPAVKPKPRPRPQQKRPPSPPPREEADADNEDSDDGGLTIEMEPDMKRRNRFMGAFDRDITANGPVSLRSAASSMSPAARDRRRDVSEESQGSRDADTTQELKPPSPRRSPLARTPQQEAEDEAELEAELEMALEESTNHEESGVGLGIYDGIADGAVNGVVHDESSSESEEE
ncbi:MAG: hypothetical protein Q9191_001489 [Dirinaria sp. TL-2023a]